MQGLYVLFCYESVYEYLGSETYLMFMSFFLQFSPLAKSLLTDPWIICSGNLNCDVMEFLDSFYCVCHLGHCCTSEAHADIKSLRYPVSHRSHYDLRWNMWFWNRGDTNNKSGPIKFTRRRHQAVSCSTASASVPKPMLGKKYKADDLLDVVGLKQIPSASIPCIWHVHWCFDTLAFRANLALICV